MYIADNLNKEVNHKASLTGDDQNLLTEGLGHEDAVATVTDVTVECTNSATPVVAPLLLVLRQLCSVPGERLCEQ